jgi:hypothetical protein
MSELASTARNLELAKREVESLRTSRALHARELEVSISHGVAGFCRVVGDRAREQYVWLGVSLFRRPSHSACRIRAVLKANLEQAVSAMTGSAGALRTQQQESDRLARKVEALEAALTTAGLENARLRKRVAGEQAATVCAGI